MFMHINNIDTHQGELVMGNGIISRVSIHHSIIEHLSRLLEEAFADSGHPIVVSDLKTLIQSLVQYDTEVIRRQDNTSSAVL